MDTDVSAYFIPGDVNTFHSTLQGKEIVFIYDGIAVSRLPSVPRLFPNPLRHGFDHEFTVGMDG